MQECFLENKHLKVTVGTLGAELLSLRGPDGKEQMWEGNPDIWGRRGPVIFPILGGWPEGKYIHKDNAYQMDKNGFARSAEFELLNAQPNRAELELRWNEESWKQYPFAFRLKICYYLKDTRLIIEQSVENESAEEMPVSLGMHPGFFWNREKIGNHLVFSCPQTLKAFHPDGKRYVFLNNQQSIILTEDLFSDGAISMEYPEFEWIEFRRPMEKYILRIYAQEHDYLTLWSPDRVDANFLCIEPSTSVGTDGNRLIDRRGISILKPGCTMCRKMMIELLPTEGV